MMGKARQLSLLFESSFVSAAHFDCTESEELSLAATDNDMISLGLDLHYSLQI